MKELINKEIVKIGDKYYRVLVPIVRTPHFRRIYRRLERD
jgi:hypothetical protein